MGQKRFGGGGGGGSGTQQLVRAAATFEPAVEVATPPVWAMQERLGLARHSSGVLAKPVRSIAEMSRQLDQ